jgi:hypothetical protein
MRVNTVLFADIFCVLCGTQSCIMLYIIPTDSVSCFSNIFI